MASRGQRRFVTYVLEVNVSLAGDVIDHVANILLPAATDEILLGHTVLRTHTRTHTHTNNERFLDGPQSSYSHDGAASSFYFFCYRLVSACPSMFSELVQTSQNAMTSATSNCIILSTHTLN